MSSKFANCVFSVSRFDPFLFVHTCKDYIHVYQLYIYIIMLKPGLSRLNQGTNSSVYYRVKFDSQKSKQNRFCSENSSFALKRFAKFGNYSLL